jgi:ParB-like chromosome segregation protein Spo0J
MIVAGERRFRASKLAGLETISAIVREDLTDKGVAELALIENLLRRDLDAIEEACAYQAMLDSQGYTVETLASLLGHAGTQKVTGRLSLLNLDSAFQTAVQKGILGATSAAEMAKLSTEGQFQLWNAIQSGKADTPPKVRGLAAAILDLERQTTMFESEPNSPDQRAAADKVNRFIEKAGELLGMLTEDDLTTIRGVAKSDAPLCLDRLFLLTKEIYRVQNALADNVAKQQAMTV